MKLLLDREQKSAAVFTLVPLKFGNSSTFMLNAEIELDAKEKRLIEKHNLHKGTLYALGFVEEIKTAFWPAFILGVLSFVIIGIFWSFIGAVPLSLLVTLIMTGVYFYTMREEIIISHLLNGGRKFRCDSIVDLIHKEDHIEGVVQCLKQVLVSAENWDDRETISIKALDKVAAKQAVLKARPVTKWPY